MKIPDSVIHNLSEHSGAVVVYLKKGEMDSGFPLRQDEFVTSIRVLSEMLNKAGLSVSFTDKSFKI